jgi:putative hydrolase of the HAD superfamily
MRWLMKTRRARALLIDADDTLWENNIYFLEVTERFVAELQRHGVDPGTARVHLNEVEHRNIPIHGYGSGSFAISVAEAFSALAPDLPTERADEIVELARAIARREEPEILPGVREGLERLARSYRLILLTKGHREEQERKVERSRLAPYFERVEVVPEKNVETYLELIERLDLDPAETWMIGNSPRSDINPALAAGLRAVLVPHPQTWELEVEEIDAESERLVIADRFGDLVVLFSPDDDPS